MDQERLMIPLKRELNQLRSQAFVDGQKVSALFNPKPQRQWLEFMQFGSVTFSVFYTVSMHLNSKKL